MFKLILTVPDKNQLVLHPEAELKGLAFLSKARECLRLNLDFNDKAIHQTLGSIAQYDINVDEAMAKESGKYLSTDECVITVSDDFLKKYIFYGGNFSYVDSKSYPRNAMYPYFTRSIVLNSFIDELAVLEMWKSKGYPMHLD